MPRKPRSDRNHLLYRIDCTDGRFYIGMTVLYKQRYKDTLRLRLKRHVTRATNETKDWELCRAIRAMGPDAFTISLVVVVRGKANAHRMEVEYIRRLKPTLNTASVRR